MRVFGSLQSDFFFFLLYYPLPNAALLLEWLVIILFYCAIDLA